MACKIFLTSAVSPSLFSLLSFSVSRRQRLAVDTETWQAGLSLSSPGCFCFWYVLFFCGSTVLFFKYTRPKIMSGLLYGWPKGARVLEMNQDEMVSMERTDYWKIERKKMRSMCACAGCGRCLFCRLWRVYKTQPSSTSSCLWVEALFSLVTRCFLPDWLFQLPLEKATSI